ncbi:PAS domain-containing protein [Palleronia caenipelagi]|uniref:PAS domain-containing protein n=1 Tax=Palleronia caenipelagi TaxID=2489174 RepID=A0A547Q6P3_9RHOB|nr:PAS domain-containing protein [Palleronia caenipelagi]TRD22049.1 PAS domain-containing protein [Palleronia caenipelagi]
MTDDTLWRQLVARFPTLAPLVHDMGDGETEMLMAADGLSRARLERSGNRVTLEALDDRNDRVEIDRVCINALQLECAAKNRLIKALPFPVWQHDAAERIVWANRAYMDVVGAGQDIWPIPRIAGHDMSTDGGRLEMGDRQYVFASTESVDSIICALLPTGEARGAGRINQSMSRIFSQLPNGLAIYDAEGRISAFNPAWLDLTGLAAEWILTNPLRNSLFDRFEACGIAGQIEGEDLRTRFARQAQRNGQIMEIWRQEDGRILRFSANLQEDGSCGFMLEDATAEIRQVQRAQSELSSYRAAFDALPGATALCDRDGALTYANHAFRKIWPSARPGQSWGELSDQWRLKIPAGDIPDLHALTGSGDRVEPLEDRALQVNPLGQHGFIVRYNPEMTADAVLESWRA